MNYWHLTLPDATVMLAIADMRYKSRATQQSRMQVVQLHDGSLRDATLKMKARTRREAQTISARLTAISHGLFRMLLPVDGVTQFVSIRITGTITQKADSVGVEFSMPIQIIGPYQITEADLTALGTETADGSLFAASDGYFYKFTNQYLS